MPSATKHGKVKAALIDIDQARRFMPALAELELPRCYRAEAGEGSTVVVRNVPIFAENERQFYGQKLTYDREWLVVAAARDRALRKTGYKAPMHFGHHEAGLVRKRAGHFEVEDVRLALVDGQLLWTTFATLVFQDRETFEEMKKSWPYRSVEVSFERPNEYNSLALLSSEAPFFRFPDLVFGSLVTGAPATFVWRHKFMPADALNPTAPAATPETTKQQFAAPPFAKDKEKKPEAEPDGDEKGGKAEGSHPEPDGDEPHTPEQEKDLAAAGKSGGMNFDQFATAVMGMLNTMMAAIVKLSGGDNKPEGTGGYGSAKAAPPVVAAQSQVTDAATATLQGKIAVLEAQLAKLTKERADEATFATLKAELLPYGVLNLDAQLREHLAAGTHAAFAAAVKSFAPPTKRASEAPVESVDPKEVQAYSAKGPEILAEARRLYAAYQAAPKGSLVKNHTVDRFLAVNLGEVN